ncbi:histidine utilization repressor [Pandoraea terrae]|uniref:Histidine utilization repressor n=1 Tax=Pandoraea terrae TaxID=1537710 RepID=A0A5E4RSF1_9BURK|nr:histidine utilization repressor [Pandoraea terrae]VVD65691.1 histidine utilization repressor [Pandoraea terrae]
MRNLSQSANSEANAPAALYKQIKQLIQDRVRRGEWKPGDRIPSENNLVDTLGVSRMTVNRALRELTEQGTLVRLSGVGTFVAESKPQSTLLMIAQINDEVRARGHEYSHEILLQRREPAPGEVAAALGLTALASVFHVVVLHRENGLPVQLEDRFVNPKAAPAFIDQDFAQNLPSKYLLATVPAHEIEHVVDAVLPTPEQAKTLEIGAEACLSLTRRTWSSGVPVTFARFIHPGSRYRLGCRFQPADAQQHS